MPVSDWLERHRYLEGIARFEAGIDEVLDGLSWAPPAIPVWDAYAGDLDAGVPVLASTSVTVDLAPLEALTAKLIGTNPGHTHHLGWRAAARYLAPVVRSFDGWRGDDEKWLRPYCPLCGSPPAMAQLVGTEPGRRRLLCCGRCGARWRFRRTECPFCEHDDHQLATLKIEGESGLRIDRCESCRSYIKTYDGEGDEKLLLADWSSLHLDVVALDRGWVRAAASLYEIPA